jgi:hypothetical protein
MATKGNIKNCLLIPCSCSSEAKTLKPGIRWMESILAKKKNKKNKKLFF